MRIRSIKPEFWRSDDITALSREHRLLFIGLWSYVDDNGVGIDDHRQIAADLFALEDDLKEARDFVREGLATLAQAGLITRYTSQGKAVLFVTGWDKHQRIDRPSRTRYQRPTATGGPPTSGNGILDEDSRDPRETVASHSRGLDTGANRTLITESIQRSGGPDSAFVSGDGGNPLTSKNSDPRETLARPSRLEQGNRGLKDMSADTADVHEAPGFAEFWQRYPRKEKRQDAERAWKTHVIRRRVYQRALFDALDAHIRHWRDRYGDDTQYVPLAPTWLRNERWTDELPGHPAAAQEVNLHTVDDYLDHAAGTEAARLLGVAYLPDPQPPSDQTAPREWEREAARRWITHHAAALRERLAQLKDTG
jgi:hypothetical protein